MEGDSLEEQQWNFIPQIKLNNQEVYHRDESAFLFFSCDFFAMTTAVMNVMEKNLTAGQRTAIFPTSKKKATSD